MALAAVLKYTDFSRRRKKRGVEVTMSTNYVTGGDTLNLATMTNPSFLAGAGFGAVPTVVETTIKNCPDGYTAEYIPGGTLATCKIKFRSTADTELAAGAYPANLAAAKLELEFSGKMYSGM